MGCVRSSPPRAYGDFLPFAHVAMRGHSFEEGLRMRSQPSPVLNGERDYNVRAPVSDRGFYG